MKELSIEEKARRYDEAIEIAKKINNEHKAQPFDVMLKLFPELAESEDEKIRKAIKKALQVRCDGSRIISDEPVTLEEAIAWLEKQGEQKPQRMVSAEAKEAMYNKPAWSEDDEMMLRYAIEYFERQKRYYIEGGDGKKTMQEFIDWFKSLKERYTWKPSEEQIDALEDAIADAVSSIQKNMLNSLYSDLKKLKGE